MSNNNNITLSFTCDVNDSATQEIFDHLTNPVEQYDHNLIINSPEHKGKIYMFNRGDITQVNTSIINKVSINVRAVKNIDPALRLHEVAK
jgi:hypothetical protein